MSLGTASLLALLLLACDPHAEDSGGPVGDGGAGDGGAGDGGTGDGGTGDGGPGDGGTGDGGTGDGGTGTVREQVVYVNELMADNTRTLQDESGEHEDWIELYNAGPVDVDLAGWTISDDLDEPDKHTLGDLVLPAGGHLLLYADDEADYGPQHLSFSLAVDGEAVALYDDLGLPVDLLTYDPQLADVSAARAWDGSATWTMGWPSTPGASNGAGAAEPDPTATVEAVPEAAWEDEALFSDEELPAFALELSEAAIEDLVLEPFEYVQGALIYEGVRYEPVGIRTKGENSWQPITEKPSLKIKLDAYDDGPVHLLGHTELTLQNMDNDPSMMHERVGYRLYREAGVPAARATHATLTVNGEDYGLYTHLETVDERMVGRWFPGAEGNLFEQWDVDWYDRYVDLFELEFGEEDRTNLQGLADAMERVDPGQAVLDAEDHLSWEGFLRYWAVGAVVGQFDAYPYSSPGDDCHVYDDVESGVLHYIPHGLDESFSSPGGDVAGGAIGVLAQTCQEDEDCMAAFVAEVEEVLAVAEHVDLAGYAAEVRTQVADLVAADPRRPYDEAEVAAGQDLMAAFIAGRRAELARQLGLAP